MVIRMDPEKQRRRLNESKIDSLRKITIEKHKLCGGTGFREELVPSEDKDHALAKKILISCKCRRKFEFRSRLILSNIHYKSLINQRIYGKLVEDGCAHRRYESSRNRHGGGTPNGLRAARGTHVHLGEPRRHAAYADQ